MKKEDKVVLFTVFVLLVGIIILMTIMCVQRGSISFKRNIVKENVIKEEKVVSENIVFLGDSITEFYDLDKYFEEVYHVQSGHSGDLTKDVLNNMNDRVYVYNPSKVFIMLGINDFVWHDTSADDVVKDIKEICERIKANRPYTEIILESIYPYSNEWKDAHSEYAHDEEDVNKRIKEANRQLKDYANEKNFGYIDIYSKLLNDEGKYDSKYTDDGLHPNEEAYKLITEEIEKYLK